MPVTLMGFYLQGFSPSQSLRYLSAPAALPTLAPLTTSQELKPRPQGFPPCEDPTPPARREPLPEADALLVFSPSRGFPLAVFRCRRNASPRELCHRRSEPRRCWLSRVSRPARLACLSRDCRPLWALCTSFQTRRLDGLPCLAYWFTLERRCRYRPFLLEFSMSTPSTAARQP
jgi:hypothetical protein